jgi:hypothetical protein
LPRIGYVPSDGPERWSGGTLFPVASKKVGRGPSTPPRATAGGGGGQPLGLRRQPRVAAPLQLEVRREIGRAVVNFKGPLVFCVVARYHGGAYVRLLKTLNPR